MLVRVEHYQLATSNNRDAHFKSLEDHVQVYYKHLNVSVPGSVKQVLLSKNFQSTLLIVELDLLQTICLMIPWLS